VVEKLSQSVGVLEVGFGNLPSLQRILKQLDFEINLIMDEISLLETEYLIIPGVGSFPTAMNFLNINGLTEALKYRCEALDKPTLGICLGAQILLEEGFEVVNSSDFLEIKNSHNGWDVIEITRPVLGLNTGVKIDTYFNHDFIFSDINPSNVCAIANHGGIFPVILKRNETLALQFHPEKSQSTGLRMLKSFLGLTNV
jgi:glutamine amidotransferase